MVFSFFRTVCLPDSILAFHKNGMQGRSLKNGEITQEITDLSRTYRLLGSDKYVFAQSNLIWHSKCHGLFFLNNLIFFHRVVALESHLVRAGSLTQDEGHDLHILAGHEASY